MDAKIWASLPETRNVEFEFQGHKDSEGTYSEPMLLKPYNVNKCSTEFEWEGIRFTASKEWFGAPRNPHLFLFRQTVEPFANCDFTMKTWIEEPSGDSEWTIVETIDQEDNSCGLLLRNKEGRMGLLAETTQITSFSLRVTESRDKVTRDYKLMAFEESPIRLEKYVSFHMDDEEDYQALAFRECRMASRTRFDDIRGVGAWDIRTGE